ncbi:MAG: hypothetical protein ACO263_11315, partial [Cyclobacteriaceae bacterium]
GISGNIYSGNHYTNTLDSIGTTLNIGNTNSTTVNLGTSNTTTSINIGTGVGTTTINIGASGDTINIAGSVNNVNTTDLNVTDKLITLNKDAIGSGTARSTNPRCRTTAGATGRYNSQARLTP